MSIQAVLLPVFVQVALTFVLLFAMGGARFFAFRAKEVKILDLPASQYQWPARASQVSRSFHNQLETPMLFYVLVALAIITKKDDFLFVVLSWIWVGLRIAHVLVHTTSNRISLRFPLFLASVVVLMIMWAIFALRVLTS
jgi:hypothetical protein